MLPLFVIVSIFYGCAHVVSEGLRSQVDTSVTPSLLFANPEAYRGKVVILGGDIVKTGNRREGTTIEVIQKPLDYRGRPVVSDRSAGRFLILYDGYLDPVIYQKGKMITVAGEVIGSSLLPLGQMDYSYPLIKSRELYLTEPGYGMPVFFGIGAGVTVH